MHIKAKKEAKKEDLFLCAILISFFAQGRPKTIFSFIVQNREQRDSNPRPLA